MKINKLIGTLSILLGTSLTFLQAQEIPIILAKHSTTLIITMGSLAWQWEYTTSR